MATQQTPAQKIAGLRIQRALAKPGAIGMKGFLLWTEAAWPPAISKKILEAANKYTPGAGPPVTLASPAAQGFGRFGRVGMFGDNSGLADVTIDLSSIQVPDSVTQSISDATQAPVSGTTAATPSQPASASWMSDVGSAITAATTAYLGATQVKNAQTIFNTNLQRAQQGLPMIPTNPTQYGLPAPTAQIGLTSSTSEVLLIGLGILGVALIGGGMLSGRKSK